MMQRNQKGIKTIRKQGKTDVLGGLKVNRNHSSPTNPNPPREIFTSINLLTTHRRPRHAKRGGAKRSEFM